MTSPTYSVIIPTLHEANRVHSCVTRVRALNPATEVIVVDGDSRDGTAERAHQAGARIIRTQPGRGIQCNAGAALASGAVLLFLHVDTILPDDAFPQLDRVFADPQVMIGTFRLRFDTPHWLLGLYARFTRFDDQCIVVRKPFFEALGRFPAWPLFEDVRLLQLARGCTRIVSIPATVTTSARRFVQNGVVCQQLRNSWLMLQYLLGVSPFRLAAGYTRTKVTHRRAQ